jgi:hypothetical protein
VCATDTFEVGVDYNFSNNRISNLWAVGSITTNQMIYIEDTLVIDKNFSFINCPNIYLGTDAVIYVLTGVTFLIDSSTLQSCGAMWQGIILESDVALTVQSGSLIKDAQKAIANSVNSVGGGLGVNITNSTFDQNNISISMQALYATLTITGSKFTHSSSNHLLQKAPLVGQEGFAHIELKDVMNLVSIGDATEGQNKLSFGQYGIMSTSSNVNILNNQFSNFISNCVPIMGDDGCNATHAAIFARGDNQLSFDLRVGGSNLERNYFYNNTVQIYTVTNIKLEVISNEIDNGSVTNPYLSQSLSWGIWTNRILDSANAQIIVENFIKDIHFPIAIYHSRGNDINVLENIILYRGSVAQNPGSDIGIQVRNDIFDRGSNPVLRVAGNYILGRARGILITQINDGFLEGNYSSMLWAQSVRMQYGLKLQGCNGMVVSGNQHTRSMAPIWQEETSAIGITVEGGINNQLLNNYIKNFGTGIRFYNCLNTNQVFCNELDTFITGITLERSNIGVQGSASSASDNRWYRGGGSAFNLKGINLPYQFGPVWFMRSQLNFDPTSHLSSPTIITPDFNTQPSTSCEEKCSDPECEQSNVERIMQQSLSNVNPEVSYELKRYVFETLDQKRNLMELGTQKDLILRSFYDSLKTTGIGQLIAITDTLSSDTVHALMVTTTISPENNFEVNAIQYKKILLESYGYHFEPEQKESLKIMAFENPVSGGTTSYDARVALRIDADDFTISNLRRSNYGGLQAQARSFEVYPIPTHGTIKVSAGLGIMDQINCKIISMNGDELISFNLVQNDSEKEVDLSKYAKGIYHCNFYQNFILVKSIKIVVQ